MRVEEARTSETDKAKFRSDAMSASHNLEGQVRVGYGPLLHRNERLLRRENGRSVPARQLALSAYAVEKPDSRFLRGDFGGLKPSPD